MYLLPDSIKAANAIDRQLDSVFPYIHCTVLFLNH